MKDINDVSLLDITPDNLAKDEKVEGAALAIDPQLRLVAGNVDIPALYDSVDRLTGEQLDHLAVQWDATVWRDSWPVVMKRSVFKATVREKRKKGTVSAVREALSSIQSACTIEEWWQTEPKGEPHTFTIFATLGKIEGTLDSEMQEDLFALIDDAKPVRSWYKFVVTRDYHGGIGMTALIRPVTCARVTSESIESATAQTSVGVYPAVRAYVSTTFIGRAK